MIVEARRSALYRHEKSWAGCNNNGKIFFFQSKLRHPFLFLLFSLYFCSIDDNLISGDDGWYKTPPHAVCCSWPASQVAPRGSAWLAGFWSFPKIVPKVQYYSKFYSEQLFLLRRLQIPNQFGSDELIWIKTNFFLLFLFKQFLLVLFQSVWPQISWRDASPQLNIYFLLHGFSPSFSPLLRYISFAQSYTLFAPLLTQFLFFLKLDITFVHFYNYE